MEIQEMFNILLGEIRELKSSVSNLEKRFDNLEQRVDCIEKKIDVLDERITKLEKGQAEIRENIVRFTEIPGKDTQNLRDELNAAKQIIGINSVDIQMLKSKIG